MCQNNSSCQNCFLGNVFNGVPAPGEKYCTKCQDQSCRSCNSDLAKCQGCYQGFYLDNDTCNKCPDGCYFCNNITAANGKCLSCDHNKAYYVIGNSSGGVSCGKCLTNCQYCAQQDVCLKCDQGYQLSSDGKTCNKMVKKKGKKLTKTHWIIIGGSLFVIGLSVQLIVLATKGAAAKAAVKTQAAV